MIKSTTIGEIKSTPGEKKGPKEMNKVEVDGVGGKTVVTNGKTTVTSGLNIRFMSDLSALRYRLETAESGLIQDLHVPLNENSVQQCSQRLVRLQVYTNIIINDIIVTREICDPVCEVFSISIKIIL